MAMQSQTSARPNDYLKGRIPLPDFVLGKRQEPWGLVGQVTVTNNNTGRLDLQVQDDAHFLVESILMISSDQTVNQDKATVQATDSSNSRSWSNAAVPLRDFAGKGDSPKYIEPNLLRPASTLSLQVANSIGSTATFYACLMGRKIYDLKKEEADFMTRRLWFQYVLNVASLGASAVDTIANLQIYNESDFLVKKLLSQQLIDAIIGATAGSESAEVLLNLTDTTRDRRLFSTKVAARCIFGMQAGVIFNNAASWANGSAFCLRKPWLLRRNGQLEGRFDNKSTGAISNGFNVILEGVRVFDGVASPPTPGQIPTPGIGLI